MCIVGSVAVYFQVNVVSRLTITTCGLDSRRDEMKFRRLLATPTRESHADRCSGNYQLRLLISDTDAGNRAACERQIVGFDTIGEDHTAR